MAWYNTGTVTVTNGGATITGSGTAFVANVRVGDAFIGPSGAPYEVTAVNSNTSLTIDPTYVGTTAAGQAYRIQPTSGREIDLALKVQALITTFEGIASAAGVGIFASGSDAAPGVRFTGDLNTGLRQTAADTLALIIGGAQALILASGGVTGSLVQSSTHDTGAGKLLKQGAFGWGLSDANGIAPPTGDFDALRTTGLWRTNSSGNTGYPGFHCSIFHFSRLAGQAAGNHMQLAIGGGGEVATRVMADVSGNWAPWVLMRPVNSEVDLGGQMVGGGAATLADDTAATFALPTGRKTGLAIVTSGAMNNSGLAAESAIVFFDVGTSLAIEKLSATATYGNLVNTVTTDVTGTSGTDGRITISATAGTFKVENRMGASRGIGVTFI